MIYLFKMKEKLLFFICMLCIIDTIVVAQVKTKTDSIREAFLLEKNDSLKTEKHLQYIGSLLKKDKNLKEAEKEIQIVKNSKDLLQFSTTQSWLYYYEALILYYNTQYIPSIILLEKAQLSIRKMAESAGINKCEASIFNLIGLNYSNINDWENAQVNYQKAINVLEKNNDSSGISFVYMNMAYIFLDYQDWVNAAISLNKSLKYMTQADDKSYQVMIFSTLADVYSKTGNGKEALIYLNKSDSVLKLYKADESYLFNYLAKAEYFYCHQQFDAALKYSIPAITFARRWDDSTFVATALELTARIYRGQKNYNLASDYLSAGILIADKYNYLALKKANLREQINLYAETQQFKQAFLSSEKLISISDSLNMIMNNNRRIINDASYEAGKKEKRISALEQENELQLLRLKQKNYFNYFLIGSTLIILLFSFLSYRNYKQKQKLQQQRISELEIEKQLTATEAVLKGEEQERTRLAKDLHDGLGGMLSGIKYSFNTMKGNLIMTPENNQAFERSMDMLDSSIKEMRRVAHNMMPEALVKFGLDTALKDFCNDINQSGALQVNYQSIGMGNVVIEQTMAITIYRIVQELINNTMKHAAAKTAIVQVAKSDGYLSVTVEDDGKGFETAILHQSKGIGWSNIQNRIEFLKGTLDVQSEKEKGTSVHIELNI